MANLIFSLVFIFFCSAIAESLRVRDTRETVEALSKKIRLLQVERTVPPAPPLAWGKFRGIYESDIRQYFHGNPDMTAFRYALKIFDNNMFATAWITSCLLEAYKYGKAPKPSEEQLMASVDILMNQHVNKNLNYTNSIMAFWPQLYSYETKTYQSSPVNLLAMFNSTDLVNWTSVYEEMDKLGLKDLADIMKRLLASKNGYKNVFEIPPDFDDTSVNLGMGSLLKEMAIEFPKSNALWQTRNSNLSSVFSAIKKYAYRPTSGDRRVNTIDTRTYFYMRKFLELSKNESKDVALISTWVQDLVEVRTDYFKGVKIPGNVNNVDITVAANGLYGITNSILSGLVTAEVLEDLDMQKIYINTSTMIAYEINTNFSARPDLALTYYPSEIEFYWFVGRTYSQLNRRNKTNGLPHEVMRTVMNILGDVLQKYVTDKLVRVAVPEGEDMVYYDDFLGNGDYDQNGNPVKYAEDRLFTTAMAVNALMTTWTYFNDSTRKLVWEKETPQNVRDTVTKAANFLDKYILTDDYRPWNAFFSGSFKGFGTFWTEFPANRDEYFNGTAVPSGSKRHGDIRGMEGVANPDWYENEVNVQHSPVVFHGYNNGKDYFPFWSSEPYTYTVAMLALSTFSNIE